MRDFVSNFGTNAGKIWAALSINHSLTKDQIKNITHLDDYDFYTGIGWLARENKIYKEYNDKYKLGNTNLTYKVGTNAGKIWKVLEIWEEVDLTSIKRLSYLDENDIYLALGWLGREDKIFRNDKKRYNLK